MVTYQTYLFSFHFENLRAMITSHWAAWRVFRDICVLRSVNTSPDVKMLSLTAHQRKRTGRKVKLSTSLGKKARPPEG